MGVIDVRFSNDQTFLLKHHGFSVEILSEQIRQFKYELAYEQFRHLKGIEENRQFPPFAVSFYSFVFYRERLPSPTELISAYFEDNCNIFAFSDDRKSFTLQGETFSADNLSARLLRTYPSLIRDFHFFVFLTESTLFDKITYSLKDDINGTDIVIKHKSKEYTLSLRVDTLRSNFFKRIKNRFRHKYEKDIDVPLRFSNNEPYKCGDIYLYGKDHLEYLKSKIQ